MFDSAILEVAVGLFFIYLLLSLVCSALNELLAGWLAEPARQELGAGAPQHPG